MRMSPSVTGVAVTPPARPEPKLMMNWAAGPRFVERIAVIW